MGILDLFRRGRGDRRDQSESGEPVFLISAPLVWTGHVETYLEDKGIPYLRQGRKGAALAIELGPVSERYDYYIPPQALEKVREDLDELRELVGG